MTRSTILFLAAVTFMVLPLEAQKKKKKFKVKSEHPSEWMFNQRAYPTGKIDKVAMAKASKQTKAARKSPSLKLNANWQLKGPINTGGRITDIAISPENDNHFYISTAVGGVFKTTDRGASWVPIFDGVGRPSIGNIAIAPSNAQRIYVGTGEANGSASSGAFFGDGVYRSDDAGQSWTSLGLEATEHVGRIIVDPNNQDRVFVASTGVLYGKNNERGVYRSIDAGENWEQVLFVSDSTACIDIIMHPDEPNILLAAMWERVRYPWVRDYAGETSGIYRSDDGGDNWTLIGNGLPGPDTETGRIGLSISRSGNSDIYASYATDPITNEFDELYKSDDMGITWESTNSNAIDDVNSTFGWYFGNVRVHPTLIEKVYVLGQQLYRSNNGGNTWNNDTDQMHVDFHSMDFSWSDPEMMLMGTDGGLYISEDGGNTWDHFDNLPITQFYNIEVNEQNADQLYGGTQDNNTIRTLSGDLDDFDGILGGDGFHVIVDPTDDNYVYAEYQFGNLFRSTDGGFNMEYALEGIDGDDRNNWNTPVIMSPFDNEVLFYGSNRLYKSTNRAESWGVISDDLTYGPVPSSGSSYATLTAIAASYNNLDVIYTGSDDGRMSITTDGGNSWTNIDEQLPQRYITAIAIDPTDDMTAYVTMSGFRNLDQASHVYKTVDGGANWVAISEGLPDLPVNDIVIYENQDQRMLIIANDMGVWYTSNEGDTWDIVGENLPMTIVMDLRIHQPSNTLIAGTFGRSIHSYDLTDLVSSIDELVYEGENVFAYPVPVDDILNIKVEGTIDFKTSGLLTDMNGNIVANMYPSFESYEKMSFDVSQVANGVYLLELKSNKKYKTVRVIIER